MLRALLVAVEATGASRDTITLNISNVVVEPPGDGEEMKEPAAGEYVALTIHSAADLGPDATWNPDLPGVDGILARLQQPFAGAGVRFAYVRRLNDTGSVTVFLPRLRLT